LVKTLKNSTMGQNKWKNLLCKGLTCSFLNFHFRSILISFVCLMTGAAFGRELQFGYGIRDFTLWTLHEFCITTGVDYSAKFEKEKHTFIGSPTQKSGAKSFEISRSPKIDFIPLDILTEFPNLNGIIINLSNLPVLKEGLFKPDFQKIELLNLEANNIETIEPNALQHLSKLKWIRLFDNNLKSLPYQVFKNNPDLIYIDLNENQLNSIHPKFFDGLLKLKLIELDFANLCIEENIGCETCLIKQSDLKAKLQKCFDNCSDGTDCFNSYQAHGN
jgi:Leucine-rich repeat (LRR) protein